MKYRNRQSHGWDNVFTAITMEALWNWIRQRSGEDITREEFLQGVAHMPNLLKVALWGGYYVRKLMAFFDNLRR